MVGMPVGRHETPDSQLPWLPSFCSAMLFSKTLRYSGVSGACWPSPQGLLGSNAGWPRTPSRTATHCPERSGYFASSKAHADIEATLCAATRAAVPIHPCKLMTFLFLGLRARCDCAEVPWQGPETIRF